MQIQGEPGNYLKIASASIYIFDYFQTLPSEIRFYRRQGGFLKTSIPCWLLITVRYLGMLGMILLLVGSFATTFTAESCARFFISVPVVKVLGGVASQGVFIYRTYALYNRNRNVLIFLLVLGGLLGGAEILAPVVVPRDEKLGATGNCISDFYKGSTSWIQYMCQVIFDVVNLGITGYRLFDGVTSGMILRSQFTKRLWESQLMYFFTVTAVNLINLIFFVKYNHMYESTMFASLGIAITSIYSSRVILDLQDLKHSPWVPTQPVTEQDIRTSVLLSDSILDHRWRVKATRDDLKAESFVTDIPNHSPRTASGGIQVPKEITTITNEPPMQSGQKS